MYLSNEEKILLRSIPLQDVMYANGHRPSSRAGNEIYYNCPMPNHTDKDASFCVEATPSASSVSSPAMFYCHGCKVSGSGAIELQALLMGVEPTGRDYWKVVHKLSRDHNIPVSGVSNEYEHYVLVEPVNEFKYVKAEWTPGLLSHLGCYVSPVTHAKTDGEGEEYGAEDTFGWSYVGDPSHRTPFMTTAEELGADVSSRFGVYPIAQFTLPGKAQVDGTVRSRRLSATDTYPIYIIRREDATGWRIKKYEPLSRRNDKGKSFKWTWAYPNGENRGRLYAGLLDGDSDIEDALYNKDIIPQDTSLHHDHPVVDTTEYGEDGQVVTARRFRRVCICSGPRDAMQVYYHSDCHVVWPQSETAKIDHRLLKRLLAISEQVFILFDSDKTGVRAARELNMQYMRMRNVELPSDLGLLVDRRTSCGCKDVSGYFEQYWRVLGSKSIDEHFETLLSASVPLEFWDRKRVVSNSEKPLGKCHYNYRLIFQSMIRFLAYSGMGVYDAGKSVRFFIMKDNIVEFIPDRRVVAEARQLLLSRVSSYTPYSDKDKSDLCGCVVTSKQILCIDTLLHLPKVQLNFKHWTETSDWRFFDNGALRIKADKRELVAYSELDFHVNKDEIVHVRWHDTEDEFDIDYNAALEEYEKRHRERMDEIPAYDARGMESERTRWDAERVLWTYVLKLHKPMNECLEFLQYLFDTCRMYWREEELSKRDGKQWESWLSRDRRQFQDVNFVSKVAAIGFLLCRYRTDAMQRILYLVDYKVKDEGKASGRTGKSIVGKVLGSVFPGVSIPGKNFKTSPELAARNFKDYDYLRDCFINVNDLTSMANPELFYNWAEGEYSIKNLHQDEREVPRDMAAKMMVSTNRMHDLSVPSTRGRLWPMYFSDYYHLGNGAGLVEWSPYMKFGHTLGADEDEEIVVRTINFFVKCMQVYLRFRCYIEAPVGEDGRRREMYAAFASKRWDKRFIEWADSLFARDIFFGVPLPKSDLVTSWFQFSGTEASYGAVNAFTKSRTFGDMFATYCFYAGIAMNPDSVLRTKDEQARRMVFSRAWVFEFNSVSGRLTGRRVFRDRQSCYFFYRKGNEPSELTDSMKNQSQSSDPACEGYILEG